MSIKPLLDSIAIQQNIDFNEIGVIICNDGSDCFLSDDFLAGYPDAVKSFAGEFMSQYSWAEETTGFLEMKALKK